MYSKETLNTFFDFFSLGQSGRRTATALTSPEIRVHLEDGGQDESDRSLNDLLSSVGSVEDLAAWVNGEMPGK